jgi:hypothetical protein
MINSKFLKIFSAVLIAGFLFSGTHLVFANPLTPGTSEGAQADATQGVPDYKTVEGDPATDPNREQIQEYGGLLGAMTFISVKAMTLVSGLIDVAINFGNDAIKLPIVTVGFGIALNFVNLGFVLAIIIIAFATIFRLENYAMKKTLQRLVVAALLVNFSLVIAEAFITASNTFSNYFIETFDNKSIGDSMARAMGPQQLGQILDPGAGFWEIVTGGVDWFFTYIASMAFVLIMTLLVVFMFFAVFIMLLIRAVYLSVLLIIMPVAWLAYIFPSTVKHWQKWWNEFIRWTFFAPIMLFFVYIVVLTQDGISKLESIANIKKLDANTAFKEGMVVADNFFENAAQMIIIAGLLVGGLMVANKLSITGSSTIYGLGKGAGKWTAGWVGKKTWQGATYPLRKKGAEEGARSGAEKLQDWAQSRKSKLGRITAGWIAKGAIGAAESGGKSVKEREDKVKGMSKEQAKASLLTAVSSPQIIALLKKIADEKALGDIDVKRYINNDTKKMFNSYGRGKDFEDLEKSAGMNSKMVEAIKSGKHDDIVAATKEFVAKLSKNDIGKSSIKEIFGDKPKFGLDQATVKNMGIIISDALAKSNPAIVSSIIPKLNSKERKTFKDNYKNSIKNLDPSTKEEIEKRFKKIMDNYEYGREDEKEIEEKK